MLTISAYRCVFVSIRNAIQADQRGDLFLALPLYALGLGQLLGASQGITHNDILQGIKVCMDRYRARANEIRAVLWPGVHREP